MIQMFNKDILTDKEKIEAIKARITKINEIATSHTTKTLCDYLYNEAWVTREHGSLLNGHDLLYRGHIFEYFCHNLIANLKIILMLIQYRRSIIATYITISHNRFALITSQEGNIFVYEGKDLKDLMATAVKSFNFDPKKEANTLDEESIRQLREWELSVFCVSNPL